MVDSVLLEKCFLVTIPRHQAHIFKHHTIFVNLNSATLESACSSRTVSTPMAPSTRQNRRFPAQDGIKHTHEQQIQKSSPTLRSRDSLSIASRCTSRKSTSKPFSSTSTNSAPCAMCKEDIVLQSDGDDEGIDLAGIEISEPGQLL